MSNSKQVLSVLLFSTVALALAFALSAQGEGENAIIDGTIRDADSSSPLENVTVRVSMQEGDFENSTQTNSLGSYELGVVAGDYQLMAIKNPEYYFYIDFNVSVQQGQTDTENIDLDPHGGENSGLYGRVTDGATNDPINDSAIMYMDIQNGSGWFGSLNETGEFNHTLREGSYMVRLDYQDYREFQLNDYQVVNGTFEYFDIQLWPENSTLAGYVVDNVTGDPIFNATVVITDGDPFFPTDYHNQTTTDANGLYSFNVSQGLYDIGVYGPRGYFSNLRFGIPTTTVEEVWVPLYDETRMNVSLDRSNFRGWVNDKNGDPLGFPPVLVMALNLDEGLFNDEGDDENGDGGPGGPIYMPAEDGYFEFYLTQGHWWVVGLDFALFEGENGTYDTNLSRQVIAADHEMGYLNLTLWDLNSTVRGIITDPDGLPLENATVQLYSKHTVLFDESKTVMTDNAGYYEIAAGRGDYFLMISYHPGQGGDQGDPFEGSLYERMIIPLTLGQEEDKTSNHQFSPAVVQAQYQNATIAQDWNRIDVTMQMHLSTNNSRFFRLWLDGLIGDGNYSLDQAEVDRFIEMMSANGSGEDENDLSIDGVTFNDHGASSIEMGGGLGAWDTAESLIITTTAVLQPEGVLPFNFNHTLRFNVSYANTSADPVYRVSYPVNYNLTANITSANVTFNGSNPLRIDTAMDPDPEDQVYQERIWFKVETENNLPLAFIDSIIPNPAFEGELVQFQGHGDDIDGDIVAFKWLLDGQVISTEASFQKDDIAPGNHTLGFRVQDDDGGWSPLMEVALTITDVNDPPVAHIDSIEPTNPRTKTTIYFNGTGSDTDGSITTYAWFIEGWLASSSEDFTLSNLTGGTYDVEFKVQDDNDTWSNVDSETLVVRSNQAPLASISSVTPNPANVNDTITFVGSGVDTDGTIAKYEWDFDGDGTYDHQSTTSGTTTHAYPSKGTYTAKFRVTDNDGKQDSTTVTVNIDENQVPTANIISVSPRNGLVGATFTFSGNGTDHDGTLQAYQWLIDGVEVATTPSFTKTDLAKGSYTAQFRVQDDYGAWSEYVNATFNVLEELKAIVSLSSSNVAAGDTVTIDASASMGNIISYAYEFGDGTTKAASEDSSVTHAYTADGSYTISVTVTDVLGATDSSTIVVKVGDTGGDDGGGALPGPGLPLLLLSFSGLAAVMSLRRRR